MGEKRNFAALEWVAGEIRESLNDARVALESYVEDPKDSARMRFCLTHIHQVYSVLKMVEFQGAILFAEEMEELAQAMLDNTVSHFTDAQEVLMRSLLQLPIFLDHVLEMRDEHLGIVLPLLNDMRAVRKKAYLSETNLFAPDLSSLERAVGTAHPITEDRDKFKQILAKLREMYQYSAASVLRGMKIDEYLAYIQKVFARLESITLGTQAHSLWQAAYGLIDCLSRDELELSVAVKSILRSLAREIRVLEENCPQALHAPVNENLLRNILYYVARTEDWSPRIESLDSRYQLKTALLDNALETQNYGSAMISPDADAIRAVVGALHDEITAIKQLLSVVLSGQGSVSDLEGCQPVLKRVGDTLALMGAHDLRAEALAQLSNIQALIDSHDLSEQGLEPVVNKIVALEHSLEIIDKGADKIKDINQVDERGVEIEAAQTKVINECRDDLSRLKEKLSEYDTGHDSSGIQEMPVILVDVRGALSFVPMPRACAILQATEKFVLEHFVQVDSKASYSDIVALADIVEAVDYYLDRFVSEHDDEISEFLDLAEKSLDELGFALPDYDETVTPAAVIIEPRVESDTSQSQTREDEIVDDPAGADDHVSIATTPGDETLEGDERAEEKSIDGARAATQDDTADRPADVASVTAEAEKSTGGPGSIVIDFAAVGQDVFDDSIDDEIVEIFVEEAEEVLEELHKNIPLWSADHDDQEALSVIRRNYHTLKGSGRMVKALAVGELAWSIENMLNRVIDATVVTVNEHVQIVEMVAEIVPSIVKAFENKEPTPDTDKIAHYMAWAGALAEGQVPVLKMSEQELSSAEAVEPASIETEDADLDGISEKASPAIEIPVDEPFAADNTTAEETSIEEAVGEESVDEETHDPSTIFSGETVVIKAITPEDLGEEITFEAKDLDETEDQDQEDESDDWALLELFVSETRGHCATVDEFIASMDEAAPLYEPPSDLMQKALHTLKGSSHMVGITEIATLVTPLESLMKEMRTYQIKVDPDVLQLLRDGSSSINHAINQIESRQEVNIPHLDQFVARTKELAEARMADLLQSKSHAEDKQHPVDPSLLSIIMTEQMDLLLDADKVVARWQTDGTNSQEQEHLLAELTKIQDGAVQANLPEMSRVCGELMAVHQALIHGDLVSDEQTLEGLNLHHEYLLDMLDCVAAGQDLPTLSRESQAKIDALLDRSADQGELEPESIDTQGQIEVDEVESDEVEPASGVEIDNFEQTGTDGGMFSSTETYESSEVDRSASEPEEPEVSLEPESTPEPEAASASQDGSSDGYNIAKLFPAVAGIDIAKIDDDDLDIDILEVFLDEAEEIVEQLDEAIHEWQSNYDSHEADDTMKRGLHTLKGGARLAGLSSMGDLTHEYETFLIGSQGPHKDDSFFPVIHQFQDMTIRGINAVKGLLSDAVEDAEQTPFHEEVHEQPDDQANQESSGPDDQAGVQSQSDGDTKPYNIFPINKAIGQQKAGDTEFSMPPPPAAEASNQLSSGSKRGGSQEVVKIQADLLEELVNLAGETSISRGRLEQQVSDFGSSISEMDTTLRRLQEQLRRLDIETEAQILFRQEQLGEHDSFDPLEMDRYSQLQQLSRSLTESASDLIDLKSTLGDKVKETESLLLHQQRVNSSLQEGLMRARMVPFSRLVPRLRRIVRQVASELGKQVNFELDNVEGEMDRSVLEHMVAPLEHMLRNAVDHGVELPEERVSAGKAETGRILLSFAREGGDILLRLADDGRGIELDKVRSKAIERGLMSEDADLSDHDIMQFILQAGFTTSERVTQISGRGVGMDVVAAEIKQLGGSMSIESKSGVGTQFTVRLPFTVSVNRALMVTIGQDQYAIPLNSIEGIVRVSPFELEHYYSEEDACFEYAGEEYQVRYLGAMLYRDQMARLEGQTLPLPVILVRSAQHTMAFQVDELQGSREIVVKSLGPQFAAVQGLSGATVMGDGSVVVIIDPHALVRRSVATAGLSAPMHSQQLAPPEPVARAKTVMVVDDSVTVRKVTTRFLEREGYNVETAFDGVDALQKLQDIVPDLMLLDIEMPRMDGFELAKNMRTTQQWEGIPIIMITSRTGDKHRDHALSIGVNKYLGKPYQEEVLMGHIRELLGEGEE